VNVASRLTLTIDLVVPVLLRKIDVGLIAAQDSESRVELDLALIAGFLTDSGGYHSATHLVSKEMLRKAVRAQACPRKGLPRLGYGLSTSFFSH
jgi:hypothetical protein